MAIRTFNIELKVENKTLEFWKQRLADVRDAYNTAITLLSETNMPLTLANTHMVVYDKIREMFPDVPSQMVIRLQREALSAMRSRKSNKHSGKLPHKNSLSITLDKRLYSNLSYDGITVTSEEKRKRERMLFVRYKMSDYMFSNYMPCDPLLFIRNDRMFLSVPFNVPEKPLQNDLSVGVDLGMKRLFVTSEGNSYIDKRYLSRRRAIRHLKDVLKSKGTKSAKMHLSKLKRKEHNISKDMCHRAAKALIASTDASIIVMEDLKKIKKNTSKTKEGYKKTRHNNAISQVPFYMFKEILTNKATLYGKKVESVSPTYTSQTDSRTGKRDGERRGCRYVCTDNVVLDADWNAAVNIAERGLHPYTKKTPLDGALNFLCGRAQSIAHMQECR